MDIRNCLIKFKCTMTWGALIETSDPSIKLRFHVEMNFGQGIYRLELPKQLNWAACYLPDCDVPGTAAHKNEQKLNAELLAALSSVA